MNGPHALSGRFLKFGAKIGVLKDIAKRICNHLNAAATEQFGNFSDSLPFCTIHGIFASLVAKHKKNESQLLEFQTHIGTLEYLNNMHYLYIPASVLTKMGGIRSGRWICDIGNDIRFQCGPVSLGAGDAYITLSKARMKIAGLKNGDEVSVKLEKDESRYGMEMAVELEELLKQDPEGNRRFHALKPGMQRYILYYILQVKNPAGRMQRAISLIGHLKETTEGKETFRAILGKDKA